MPIKITKKIIIAGDKFLKINIADNTKTNIAMVVLLKGILEAMSLADRINSAIIPIVTPDNTPWIIDRFESDWIKEASIIMDNIGAVIIPSNANKLPRNPLHLFPVKIAVFTAIIPGRDWLIKKISVNSSNVSQLRFSTSSDLRIGKMT